MFNELWTSMLSGNEEEVQILSLNLEGECK